MINNIFDKIMDRIPFISCQEATRLISKRLDAPLSLRESIDLHLHLSVCAVCKLFKKNILALEKLIRQYAPVDEHQFPIAQKQALKKLLTQKQ